MMTSYAGVRRSWWAIVLAGALVACRPAPEPRYLATETPIDVGDGIRLCIAIAPGDPQSVWWWGAGRSGCASRSTGPGLFKGEQGKLAPSSSSSSAPLSVTFRLGTHSAARPFIDVRLTAEEGSLRSSETGSQSRLQPRQDLDVPELAGLERSVP